jgi:hypothetical protein
MIIVIVAIAVVFVVIWMEVEARVFCSGEAERAIVVTAEVTEVTTSRSDRGGILQ